MSTTPEKKVKITKKFAEDISHKNVLCPFCHGTETELYALFGSTLSTSQYYCNTCRTAFERMKWTK